MIKVLFVCLGNICRSPMAEAVFRPKVQAADLAKWIAVDSAGTGDWHTGAPPHHGTRHVLSQKGIGYEGIVARQINPADLETFDYILTMDNANLRNVQALGRVSGVVRPLLSYLPQTTVTEVPDPYYTGGFDGVYALIEEACDSLLTAIRQERDL